MQVRETTNDEGNGLLRMVRRSSGSVVTWRRAQMVLLSAQGMDVGQIAKVTFTSPNRVRDVIHNFSPHLSTKTDDRVGKWAEANNVELAYTPFYGSWLNRIEAQFTALRYFALDGTDHPSHAAQASMIHRYIAWRNRHARHPPTAPRGHRKAETIKRAKVA